MYEVSTVDLIASFPKLSLGNDQVEESEIDEFLRAEYDATLKPLPKDLKSVACIVSANEILIKSHSGWSSGNGHWYGHDVLQVYDMIHLTKKFAEEIDFTFRKRYQDGPGSPGHWPGRFQACHAEVQLIVHYYSTRNGFESDHESDPRINDCIDIHVYPRKVCQYCHDFAKWVSVMKGLQVDFYFEGQRDYPQCDNCKRYIETGHLCQERKCSMLELDMWMRRLVQAVSEFCQWQEETRRVLRRFEDFTGADEYNRIEVDRFMAEIEALKDSLGIRLNIFKLYFGAAVRLISQDRGGFEGRFPSK